jgi:hypothetical protein
MLWRRFQLGRSVNASEVLFPPLDSLQQLSEYAATYDSDERDADYKLTLEGNNLILQISEYLQDDS